MIAKGLFGFATKGQVDLRPRGDQLRQKDLLAGQRQQLVEQGPNVETIAHSQGGGGQLLSLELGTVCTGMRNSAGFKSRLEVKLPREGL